MTRDRRLAKAEKEQEARWEAARLQREQKRALAWLESMPHQDAGAEDP